MRRALIAMLPLLALCVWLWTSAILPSSNPSPPAATAFTAAQIHRAQDYRDPQYALALAALVAQLLVAWLLVWRGRRLAARLPAVVAAAVGGFVISAAALPFSYWEHRRAADAGLDVQSDPGWLRDGLLGCAVVAVAVAVVYVVGRVAYRRFGPFGVAFAAWAAVAVFTLVQPVVVDPLFTSTHALPGPVSAQAAALERRMGVHPSISIADASARTTAENAEVDGVGPTERVVVDDTSLSEPRRELQALLAHELGHVQRMHTLKGVLWFGVLGVPAILLVLAAASRLCDGRLLESAAVPVLLACTLTAATALLPVENLISRRIEAEADYAGLRATGDPQAMVALQKRLTLRDLSNPDPPGWAVWLLFDHPPVMDRIGMGRDYSSGSSSSAP